MLNTINDIADALIGEHKLLADTVHLQHAGVCITLRSNSAAVLARMRDYFPHILVNQCDGQAMEMLAMEQATLQLPITFANWQRESGKKGRKEAVYDVENGRLLHKVRTGMLFLQSPDRLIAAGPCLDNDNQLINFINNQYLNHYQNQGYALCHASALTRNGHGLAIAGLSGGGKSTLMLKLMDDAQTAFVSNDRLLVQRQSQGTDAIGIPKMPRINPGTIVHNPRLSPLLEAAEHARFLAMDRTALWQLEQKYDADIHALYGPGRVRHTTTLNSFVILNWQHDTAMPTKLTEVDLYQRGDLLPAIMKAPGPFYADRHGRFNMGDHAPEAGIYLDALQNVRIYEASGEIDFQRLSAMCQDQILSPA